MEYKKAKELMDQTDMRSVKEFREIFSSFLQEEDSNTKLKSIGYCCLKAMEEWKPDRRLKFSAIRHIIDERYGEQSPFKIKNGKENK